MLSLVIPVYNERESLPGLAEEIVSTCSSLGVEWEALFVDDGSTDDSPEVIRKLGTEQPRFGLVRLRRNFGKSAALLAGFAAARGDRIVTLDGDGQDDPAEIPRLLAKLDEGYSLVSGWKHTRQDPLRKRLPSRLFNWITARLSGVRLHDFNCGLKAYRGSAARELLLYGEMHRYVPVIGAQRGWRVTEVPVNHRARAHGRSKFGFERYLRGMFDLVTVLFLGRYRHRPLHLFGALGFAIFSVGLLTCLYLSYEKLVGGESIGDRPLLLLGVLALVVGVQILSLGLISELIAISHAEQRGARAAEYQVEEVRREGVGERDGDGAREPVARRSAAERPAPSVSVAPPATED
jgi:glycosyltransferase involved in cell wall biosynthesis